MTTKSLLRLCAGFVDVRGDLSLIVRSSWTAAAGLNQCDIAPTLHDEEQLHCPEGGSR
jgi:hypothetical protein